LFFRQGLMFLPELASVCAHPTSTSRVNGIAGVYYHNQPSLLLLVRTLMMKKVREKKCGKIFLIKFSDLYASLLVLSLQLCMPCS
jgi:hypothetical protein